MHTTALLLIDIQNDYFPGGRFSLPGAEQAGAQAGRLLAAFRERGGPVVHIQHESVRPGRLFSCPKPKDSLSMPASGPRARSR